jgi:hypothetical protein
MMSGLLSVTYEAESTGDAPLGIIFKNKACSSTGSSSHLGRGRLGDSCKTLLAGCFDLIAEIFTIMVRRQGLSSANRITD